MASRLGLFFFSTMTFLLLAQNADAKHEIIYKDRKIDVDAYLTGFPYFAFFADQDSKQIFYKRVKDGEPDQLRVQSLETKNGDKVNLDSGKILFKSDFSKRNLWGVFYSGVTKKTYIEADEHNDEVFNFYELTPEGTAKKITDVSYIYGWRVSDDDRLLLYESRSGKPELSPGDVRILDLVTLKEKVIFKDSPEKKMNWGSVNWRPDGKGVIVPFTSSAERTKSNLLYIPLEEGKEPKVLTDITIKRESVAPLNRWIDNDHFVYLSDEKGPKGIYLGSLSGGDPQLVTAGKDNVTDAAVLIVHGKSLLAAIFGDPLQSTLKIIDPITKKTLNTFQFKEVVAIADQFKNQLLLFTYSNTNPLSISEIDIFKNKIQKIDKVSYPPELLKKIVHCVPEKITYKTFDKKNIHAYILKPENPRPQSEELAFVEAFYGGNNEYSKLQNILCEAGFYVMSPAPRGSYDFGADFQHLIDGDLGGNEILDLFAAAKYLKNRFHLPENHIGAFGGSHGGYETLRLLTFPGEVNGVKETFKWGFGVADFPMTDLLRSYKAANISQWISKLTGGDPNLNREKWVDRSPETHADLLSGPVLITHGENDSRLPIEESRAMVKKLKKLGKPVTFLELKDQGHGYKGTEALSRYYRAWFDFLEKLPKE